MNLDAEPRKVVQGLVDLKTTVQKARGALALATKNLAQSSKESVEAHEKASLEEEAARKALAKARNNLREWEMFYIGYRSIDAEEGKLPSPASLIMIQHYASKL